MPILPPEIDAYAARHSTPEHPVFQALVKKTWADTEAPQMQVGRIEGALLRILARGIGAKRILEVGTFTGYSTLCLAEATPPDGEVITCDINPDTTKIARAHWDQTEHGKKITQKLGPATETIAALTGEFDFAFIDADKENYPNYWDLIAPKIRSGGIVVIDNVLWGGSVVAADPDEETLAIMKATKKASEDPRFLTSLLSVRDGMLVALKK